jgi:DNA-binding winged helix-turn-helix (wHTH) protein
MPEQIAYEFGGFRLDPEKRTLSLEGELRPLRPTAFELLLALVESHGKTVTKSEAIKRVWGSNFADDRNFHVTLHAVRQALCESAQAPSLIVRDASGYRFAADVRLRSSTADEKSHGASAYTGPSKHIAFTLGASGLYAALYAIAIPLEVAYQFDRFGASALKIALPAFGWIMFAAVASLFTDRKLTLRGSWSGVIISGFTFLLAAAILYAALTRFLPDVPITEAVFQSYPARAAYLKDVSLFLLLAFIFLILPFHFISMMEREIGRGRCRLVLDVLEGKKLAALPRGTIYPKVWVLAVALLTLAAIWLAATAHLLENLKPSSYMNLFVELVYLRGILYFGLGLICIAWYHRALNAVKRQCLVKAGRRVVD